MDGFLLYSRYDSSVTLAGVPTQAGEYPITVTITDDQGRTATSNALPFRVYSGQERLADQLTYANSTQTADGKYMYDMTPWKITAFNGGDEIVTVPRDIKAWYGSHTSGTYGELGYAVPQGTAPAQTLVVPAGCSLTLVNMDVLSSVRILVQSGGVLSLRDSVVQGVVEVQGGGSITGPGKLIAIGGSGTFGNGGSAVTGSGTISAANVFAKGGSSYFPKTGSTGGQALAQGVTPAGTSNRSLTDGALRHGGSRLGPGRTGRRLSQNRGCFPRRGLERADAAVRRRAVPGPAQGKAELTPSRQTIPSAWPRTPTRCTWLTP